jgi:hypothetical protein
MLACGRCGVAKPHSDDIIIKLANVEVLNLRFCRPTGGIGGFQILGRFSEAFNDVPAEQIDREVAKALSGVREERRRASDSLKKY